MTEKFQNKYRIPSARLRTWDYGSDGYYFITICTAHHECYFGEIRDGEMHLNELGEIAHQIWTEIPIRFPYIELGSFVVMPNHVHGILIVDKHNNMNNAVGLDVLNGTVQTRTSVETRLIASLQPRSLCASHSSTPHPSKINTTLYFQ